MVPSDNVKSLLVYIVRGGVMMGVERKKAHFIEEMGLLGLPCRLYGHRILDW